MTKWKLFHLKSIAGFLFLCTLLCSCTIPYSCYEPEKKPAGVPIEAVWAGGPDGGAYMACYEIPDDYNLVFCELYNDYSGSLWMQWEYAPENGLKLS